MKGTRTHLLLAAWVAFSAGSTARAQEPVGLVQELPDQAMIDARERYQKGVRLVQSGKHADALAAFQTVVPILRGEPNTLDLFYNLTQVTRALKRWDKVLAYAQAVVVLAPNGPDAAAMQSLIGIAKQRTTAFALSFNAPPGTTLYVDDVPADRVTWVSPGARRITASQAGHKPFSGELRVVQDATFTVVMQPLEGKLEVKSKPVEGVDVFVDDKRVGVTPLAPIALEAKRYLVRFEKPGFGSWSRYVVVEPDATFVVSPVLEPEPK